MALVIAAAVLGATLHAGSAATARSGCPLAPARATPKGQALHGDLDGDGRVDSVVVTASYASPPRCVFHLVVRFATGQSSIASLPPSCLDVACMREAHWPNVEALAAIDRRPGAEIAVTVNAGASTVFLGISTIKSHKLVRMAIPHSLQNTFAEFGSAARYDAVDCVGRSTGRVVASAVAVVGARRVLVTRRFLRVVGTRFRVYRTVNYALRDLPRFREFSGRGPFAHCLVARAR